MSNTPPPELVDYIACDRKDTDPIHRVDDDPKEAVRPWGRRVTEEVSWMRAEIDRRHDYRDLDGGSVRAARTAAPPPGRDVMTPTEEDQ